jgi:hypothetical protein
MVTVWRDLSQAVMAMERENAASSRCGERMRIFRVWLRWCYSRLERIPGIGAGETVNNKDGMPGSLHCASGR